MAIGACPAAPRSRDDVIDATTETLGRVDAIDATPAKVHSRRRVADRSSSSKQPTGVQATALGSSPPLRHNFPTFNAANPSASLSTDIAANTRPSLT